MQCAAERASLSLTLGSLTPSPVAQDDRVATLLRVCQNRDPFAAALYQAAKASGRSENRALTFEQCQNGASSRSSYRSTRPRVQRLQLIRARSGHTDEFLRFVGAFEQPHCQIHPSP